MEERDISHNLMIFHFFLLSFEWVISDLEVVVRRQFCLSRYYVNMDIGIYEALGVEGERITGISVFIITILLCHRRIYSIV